MGAVSNELWAKAEVLKMLLCSWGRFCTDRQSRRSAQAQEYCRMKLWEFQCDRARGRMFPAGDMVGSDCFPYTKQKPFWVCGRAQPSDAGRVLGSSCAAVMEMCWHLQSEHSLWMDHAQSDEVGFVLWAPWNQNTAGRHLEKKNLASLGRLLWAFFFFFSFTWKRKNLFLCQMKGEKFFCAWGVQQEFLVPSVLDCTVVPCVGGGTTFPATWLLAVLSFHLLRIFISFDTSTWTDRFFLFQLFS